MEIRILGCLVEKEATTPDNYPLSTNALVGACNQKSNRDPVVDYDDRTVDATMLELRTGKGLARTVTGGRANKHRHVLDEAWGVSRAELSVLAVLMLRGDQTPGELRTRTERMHDFGDLDELERVLEALAQRTEPFVTQLDRQPGQKERRWRHLLGDGADAAPAPVAAAAPPPQQSPSMPETSREPESAPRSESSAIAALQAEVATLRAQVERLYHLLGETPE